MSLTKKAVEQSAAIRLRQRLQPEGGNGDKIFPPTFSGGIYCWENRRIDGADVQCVLLDSVAAQANRLEEALATAVASGLKLPELRVDFGKDVPDLGQISVLAAPHRVFDAIMRDTQIDGKAFGKSALYQQLAAATTRNANALFEHAPTALLFGCWDSTGAAGGLGNKFARAITSEIVGMHAQFGETRGGIRSDPLGIIKETAVTSKDALEWEVAKSAREDDKKAIRPSEINHGNILVSAGSTEHEFVLGNQIVQHTHSTRGGVTVDHALQIAVISVNALRRLHFPDANGNASTVRDAAAQRVLLSIGLLALTLGREQGYWLRSRCGLIADGFAEFEIVNGDGNVQRAALTSKEAQKELDAAITDAKAAGLGWNDTPVVLSPQTKLVELIKKSRDLQALGKAGS
jgi:CRISPR-associated protein Csb1